MAHTARGGGEHASPPAGAGLSVHAGANLTNTYYDFKRKVDLGIYPIVTLEKQRLNMIGNLV
jgi:hypothetical protein